MKHIWIFFIVFIILPQCTSTKANKDLVDVIEFGSGGGFSGKYQEYKVDMKKKSVFKSDSILVKSLSKKEFKNLTKVLNNEDFHRIKFNHPYNKSYYISFSGNNKIVWGHPANPVPQQVKELYALLSELVK